MAAAGGSWMLPRIPGTMGRGSFRSLALSSGGLPGGSLVGAASRGLLGVRAR